MTGDLVIPTGAPWKMLAICVALAAAIVPIEASAQDDHDDFQVWSFVTIDAPLSDRIVLTVDLHAALTDDATRASQQLFRPSLSYKLGDHFAVGGGYTYLRRRPKDDDDVDEHRVFQQIRFKLHEDGEGFQLSTTTRLEQRFEAHSRGTALRLRHQTRLDLPFSRRGKVKLVLWNEPLYSLNSTEWTGRRGWNAMLDFVGVSVPLGQHMTIEPGYLNFRIFQPGRDQVNHVLGLFAAIRL